MKIRFQNMNHSLLTLNQNNFETPVNAAAQSTRDADLCFISSTQTKLFSPKKKWKKKKKKSLRGLSPSRRWPHREMRRCVWIRAPSVEMIICESAFLESPNWTLLLIQYKFNDFFSPQTNACTSFKVNIIGVRKKKQKNIFFARETACNWMWVHWETSETQTDLL